MKLKNTLLILLIFTCEVIFSEVANCKEAIVFYVATAEQEEIEAETVKLACDLLGIKLVTYLINTKNDEAMLDYLEELGDIEVLILSGEAAKYFYKENVSPFENGDKKRSILISTIGLETNAGDLKQWSGNEIESVNQYHLSSPRLSMKVIKNKEITKELGGLDHPVSISASKMINGFDVKESEGSASLITVGDAFNKAQYPIFIKTESEGKSLFFLSDWHKVIAEEREDLVKLLPWLIFLKYSFGDRCWHRVDDFANFTIDDPWIREPYGYVSFGNLCGEAKNTPFYVTIGFIPYNYKKNHGDAVEIFRKCGENFSLALHGNDHGFSEFRENVNTRTGDENANIIRPDEKNILQALYRMNTMSKETGIPYDRVMIFPRGVFTKESLGLLKKHNFLMTINSTLPLNPSVWENNVDRLRGITLQYGNFPMVLRWNVPEKIIYKRSEEEIKTWIQIRLFLDLPVLLYAHVGFFKKGAHAFNSFAEMVNNAQPEVRWSNLGTIARNLYLQRKSSEDEIEIVTYSSDITIKNDNPTVIKYVVYKEENFLVPIRSVQVNEEEYDYSQKSDHLKVELFIEPGREQNIRILYNSEYKVGSFVYSDSNFKIAIIRALSDFRDIHLSKLPFGDKIVKVLYKLGDVKHIQIIVSGSIGLFLLLIFSYVRYKRARKTIL